MSDPSTAIFISRVSANRVASAIMDKKDVKLTVHPYYRRQAMLGYSINHPDGGQLTYNEIGE